MYMDRVDNGNINVICRKDLFTLLIELETPTDGKEKMYLPSE